jgi:uracil-DNA glycosylase
MKETYVFPFGTELKQVVQTDRTAKKVFILGVYASAVHARWVGPDGKTIVTALAVASEPEIFWTGENAAEIIKSIRIPEEVGYLVPAARTLNGPSGSALDKLYLEPLGLSRADVWLCDLLPESRLNPNQKNAIKRHYNPIRAKLKLPKATIPPFRQYEIDNASRPQEILDEILESDAEMIILLGDMPIKHFLTHYSNQADSLDDFVNAPDSFYGKVHEMTIAGKPFRVLPLCHPRQAQRLGASSKKWYDFHQEWIKNINNKNRPV